MSATFGIVQLCAAESGYMSKYYPCKTVESMIFLSNQYKNDGFEISHICDTVKEIFLNIHLPPLDDGLVYKNNVLEYLIQNINIKSKYTNKLNINLSNNYVKNIIHEINNVYSHKLLFYNLPIRKQQKLSKKGMILTLPLKLEYFIQNPPELNCFLDILINVDLNYSNLIENSQIQLKDINWDIDIIGLFYDIESRNIMIQNLDLTCHKQFYKSI